MIKYTSEVNNLSEACLEGFFVGWPNPPSPQKHKEIINFIRESLPKQHI